MIPNIGQRIAIGGLMRCCTGSLELHILNNPMFPIGAIHECPHCHQKAELDEQGIWHWVHPESDLHAGVET